ncbi:hypothetical protein G0029_17785 (plasmid) [Acinetobacter sp. YH12138]|uniref:hypothetical protein n=1 Tax=Acinetobacter sp. YH12138 TaxID=2601122 RepID=UPI0015D46331|nr:hypothetical protein [Acinetobacter sp. YH12138]QOW51617.1 hypothetical protein G0029_17785 [Acinetobacter sp. YH12138]
MKLRTALVTVLAITSTFTFADNRSELTRTLSNGTFEEDKSKSTIIFQSENYLPKNENESTASIKNGILMYTNILPNFYVEPVKVKDMADFTAIDILYAKLEEAQTTINWYQNKYEKNQSKDLFNICLNIQDIQNQIAFYYANKSIVDDYNKVGKNKFDLKGNISEMNKKITKMLQPLGNKKCTEIEKQMGM